MRSILVHTIVSDYLDKNFKTEEIEEINKNLYKMCEHISETEVNADNAEKIRRGGYAGIHKGENPYRKVSEKDSGKKLRKYIK